MNIFINISHPAHVHFFKNIINRLKDEGHIVIIGIRNKEFTIQLCEYYNLTYYRLTNKGKGLIGLILELIKQQFKILNIINKHKINLMLQIGGIFNAPVGRLLGIPTIAISDTENDKIGNKVGFGLSKHILSPDCWDSGIGGYWDKQIKYPGYHELAYLSPKYHSKENNFRNIFLIRFVGWAAAHDIGEKYLSDQQKIEIVNLLKNKGKVYISSEKPLPKAIESYKCDFHPGEIHNFMKDCKMIIGESATMASEAACLGIPAIFISNTGRGYTTEQDKKYGLIKHYTLNQWEQVISTIKSWINNDISKEWKEKQIKMLNDKIEVTDFIVDFISNYPFKLSHVDFNEYKIVE